MKVSFDVEFSIGDKVEFDNKIGKDYGIITGYSIRDKNSIVYYVTWSDKNEKSHYSFEIKKVNHG